MRGIYSSPLRVYLALGALAAFGILCGLKLPVALFPNSSKPELTVGFFYSGITADEFIQTYGNDLEHAIKGLETTDVRVEKLTSDYKSNEVSYFVEFNWGSEPRVADRELRNTVTAFASRMPSEMRDTMYLWSNSEDKGFFAASYYSPTRSLDEVYKILEPILSPRLAKVLDAQDPGLWNPSNKEIRLDLDLEAMASLQIMPSHIDAAISAALGTSTGGNISVGEDRYTVQMPRKVLKVEEIAQISVTTPSGRVVHISDFARVDFGPITTETRKFLTSGAPSLILFATPKSDGNIKRMSESLVEIVEQTKGLYPDDIQNKILVDPSEFIRSSISNVLNEVGLAALIAVVILFLFIGSPRNVATAAIEIPLSMVLAFILMKYFGMNLNMISLGGLALSAGMNVDASVVVIENIFRHFKEKPGPHDAETRFEMILTAVKEVRFPIIASTISSLVVFVPLALTSSLTNAILGDLAKAVIFSHGFSAIVALILVPTIRVQLMSYEAKPPKPSPIEPLIVKLEDLYAKSLRIFVQSSVLKSTAYGLLVVGMVALISKALPKIRKELIGIPDTDWVFVSINTKGNSKMPQMEAIAAEHERRLMDKFGSDIAYTFNQVSSDRATLMARLHNKKHMDRVWKSLEAEFVDTPTERFRVFPWNPSELPIPDPPHLRIAVRSRLDAENKAEMTRSLKFLLKEDKDYPRVWSDPNVERDRAVMIEPYTDQWAQLKDAGVSIKPSDLTDLIRASTQGMRAGRLPIDNVNTNIMLRLPFEATETVEDIAAFPIGIAGRIVPLKALASVQLKPVPPVTYRENLQDLFLVKARHDKGDEALIEPSLERAKKLVGAWMEENKDALAGVTVEFEDSFAELTESLSQLKIAISISIALIFITMVMQFGAVAPAVIVLVSVPLGIVGVIAALYLFDSTVSLNSALGVILLNGIAVANSIILVDFILKLHAQGLSTIDAVVEASRKRLRPILITSLTTILGMLPIALGSGDGGKILQPLGITVSCGLWVSTVLTLFLVPALQASYLNFVESRSNAIPAKPERSTLSGLSDLTPEPAE